MVVGTRGSSTSESDGRLRDLGLPPVFNGEGDSHIAFRRWCDQVETYLELKGIAHVLHEPDAATDAERHYVSAVLTRTLDGAAYNVALSSGKRQPDVVWEKLKDRYDASRQVSVNSVWRKINRRQMGINDTPRSLINWLEQQFTEIAFISGEQPTDEEKCRSLWQILEEREEYTSMLFQASRGGEATWTRPCKDLEDLYRLRQLRRPRNLVDKPVKTVPGEAQHMTATMKKNKNKNRKGVICFGCRKPGHIRTECPEEQLRPNPVYSTPT